MQYMTVVRDNCSELDLQVNRWLENGWKLYGNPYTRASSIYQAMIKE